MPEILNSLYPTILVLHKDRFPENPTWEGSISTITVTAPQCILDYRYAMPVRTDKILKIVPSTRGSSCGWYIQYEPNDEHRYEQQGIWGTFAKQDPISRNLGNFEGREIVPFSKLPRTPTDQLLLRNTN